MRCLTQGVGGRVVVFHDLDTVVHCTAPSFPIALVTRRKDERQRCIRTLAQELLWVMVNNKRTRRVDHRETKLFERTYVGLRRKGHALARIDKAYARTPVLLDEWTRCRLHACFRARRHMVLTHGR